jgi:hypothetical protein
VNHLLAECDSEAVCTIVRDSENRARVSVETIDTVTKIQTMIQNPTTINTEQYLPQTVSTTLCALKEAGGSNYVFFPTNFYEYITFVDHFVWRFKQFGLRYNAIVTPYPDKQFCHAKMLRKLIKLVQLYGFDIEFQNKGAATKEYYFSIGFIEKVSTVKLSDDFSDLITVLSNNFHDIWMKQKLEKGWIRADHSMAPKSHSRSISIYRQASFKKEQKRDTRLREYQSLSRTDKIRIQCVVKTMLKVLLYSGYSLKCRNRNFVGIKGFNVLKYFTNQKPVIGRTLRISLNNHKKILFGMFLHRAISDGIAEVIDRIITLKKSENRNIDLNFYNENGDTPLISSIKCGYYYATYILVKEGANLECSAKLTNGMKALTVACGLNDYKSCKLLVENGADILAVDTFGLTPLHHASQKNATTISKYLTKELQRQGKFEAWTSFFFYKHGE